MFRSSKEKHEAKKVSSQPRFWTHLIGKDLDLKLPVQSTAVEEKRALFHEASSTADPQAPLQDVSSTARPQAPLQEIFSTAPPQAPVSFPFRVTIESTRNSLVLNKLHPKIYSLRCRDDLCFGEMNGLIPIDRCPHDWIAKHTNCWRERDTLAFLNTHYKHLNLCLPSWIARDWILMPAAIPLHLYIDADVTEQKEAKVDAIMREALKKLSLLHEIGITHRDIKPHNMVWYEKSVRFIDWESTRRTEWLPSTDVPISEISEFTPIKAERTAGVATYCYACPSILLNLLRKQSIKRGGSKTLNWSLAPQQDVWGLGMTWLRLLRGDELDRFGMKDNPVFGVEKRMLFMHLLQQYALRIAPQRGPLQTKTWTRRYQHLYTFKFRCTREQEWILDEKRPELRAALVWDVRQRLEAGEIAQKFSLVPSPRSSLQTKLSVRRNLHPLFQQPQLTWKLRAEIVDAMLEAVCTHGCEMQTWFLAVEMLDRFLCRSRVEQEQFNLVARACVLLASDLNDCDPLDDVVLRTGTPKSTRSVNLTPKRLECILHTVAQVLEFELWRPTVLLEFINSKRRERCTHKSTRVDKKSTGEGVDSSPVAGVSDMQTSRKQRSKQRQKAFCFMCLALYDGTYLELDNATIVQNSWVSAQTEATCNFQGATHGLAKLWG